jgi:hypothetical protein
VVLRGEARADEAADGAGAVDADVHGRTRWTMGFGAARDVRMPAYR